MFNTLKSDKIFEANPEDRIYNTGPWIKRFQIDPPSSGFHLVFQHDVTHVIQ